MLRYIAVRVRPQSLRVEAVRRDGLCRHPCDRSGRRAAVRGHETGRATVHEREEVGALDRLCLDNVPVVDIDAAQVEAQPAVGPRVHDAVDELRGAREPRGGEHGRGAGVSVG